MIVMTKKPFQKDRFKYGETNQTDIYNPEFSNNIIIKTEEEIQKFMDMSEKAYYCASFFRWYPDMFLDLMTPTESKKRLNLYQRVMLRSYFRFRETYTTIPRGSAKSFMQLLAYLLMAVMFPNIRLSIIAETKEQSASIIQDKYNEIVTDWYPFFQDEVKDFSFQRDIAVIRFQNGSRIDNLANAQTTKGQRRNRGKTLPISIVIWMIKLSELLNNRCTFNVSVS
jgi:ribonucleoside-diphosphate reductase alpha chain